MSLFSLKYPRSVTSPDRQNRPFSAISASILYPSSCNISSHSGTFQTPIPPMPVPTHYHIRTLQKRLEALEPLTLCLSALCSFLLYCSLFCFSCLYSSIVSPMMYLTAFSALLAADTMNLLSFFNTDSQFWT